MAIDEDWRVDTATVSPLLEVGRLTLTSEQETRYEPETRLDPVFVIVITELIPVAMVASTHA